MIKCLVLVCDVVPSNVSSFVELTTRYNDEPWIKVQVILLFDCS